MKRLLLPLLLLGTALLASGCIFHAGGGHGHHRHHGYHRHDDHCGHTYRRAGVRVSHGVRPAPVRTHVVVRR